MVAIAGVTPDGYRWALAPCLVVLVRELKERYPDRSTRSDGSIASAAHSKQNPTSDHEADRRDGFVKALDLTDDPPRFDPDDFVDMLIRRRDPRVKYCLVPGSRVLCRDLRWRPIEQLDVGDELVAFDEYGSNPQRRLGAKGLAGAKMRTATVEATERHVLPVSEIVTDRGVVTASNDHMWVQARAYQGSYRRWTTTEDLQPGDLIQYFADPWTTHDTFDAGWLAGMFDGEGCLSHASGGGWNLTVSQRPGPVLDKAQRVLDDLGFQTIAHPNGAVVNINIRGGLPQFLHLLGSVPTERLHLKATSETIWEGFAIPGQWPVAEVQSVTPVGSEEVVAVQTSTRTLIAEGMFSHNCIKDRRIWRSYPKPGLPAWTPEPYTGPNAHESHAHISVLTERAKDTRTWFGSNTPSTPPPPVKPKEPDVQPAVLVVLTYNACLGRNPSMQEIANGINAIDAVGQTAYVESIANSDEAEARRARG